VLLGVPAVLGFGSIVYSTYAFARDAAQAPNTPVVQGVVEHFKPQPFMPLRGSPPESFTVQGIPFSYRIGVIDGGFRKTASHGGPIKEGLLVRIHYVPDRGNLIVKLEVAESKDAT
jgi:hypothetical protein